MDLDDPQPYRAPCVVAGRPPADGLSLLLVELDGIHRRRKRRRPAGSSSIRSPTSPPAERADPPRSCATSTSLRNPLLILFHGLEGSSGSPYARALMYRPDRFRLGGGVVHFSMAAWAKPPPARAPITPATAPRSTGCCAGCAPPTPAAPCMPPMLRSAVTSCSNGWGTRRRSTPAGACRRRGQRALRPHSQWPSAGRAAFNRLAPRYFLATLKPRSLAKLRASPDWLDERRRQRATTLHDFDNAVTAPLHGFANADDYWQRASSKPWLRTRSRADPARQWRN